MFMIYNYTSNLSVLEIRIFVDINKNINRLSWIGQKYNIL